MTQQAFSLEMKHRHYLIYVLLLLWAFALRVNRFAVLGTQADEGVHVTIADRLIAGDVLYRDLFWNHTPGVDLLLAATFKALGSNVLFGRWWSIGAAMLTMAGLLLAGQQLNLDSSSPSKGPRATEIAGFLAALLFACAPLSIFWSRFVMMGNFLTAFTILSIACAMRGLKKHTRYHWLLAGGLAGLAFLTKISALVLVGALGLFLGLWWLIERRWRPVQAGLLLIAGFALALLPLAMMLLVQGTGADFFHLLSGADRLAPLLDWQDKLSELLHWAARRPFIPLALLGGLLALLARQPSYLLMLIWFGSELIALLLPPRVRLGWGGSSHYALPTVAAASLLAGGGLAWGWQELVAKPRLRLALVGFALLCAAGTLPGLVQDLNYAVRETTYPLADFTSEIAVGRALALVTPDAEPILVFANSIFYHWAHRPPANRYFHYPSYLPTSSLAAESETELVATLSRPDTGAVLLSRMYLGRVSQTILNTLFEKWVPVAILPYSYQHDVILFLPKPAPLSTPATPMQFEGGILLHALEVDVLSPTNLLVRLDWSTASPLSEDYAVFTHFVGPDGVLITQHDSLPVNGFRPTTSWRQGEVIIDWHWLELPPDVPADTYEIRVGMYQPQTGQRLNIQTADEVDTSFISTYVQLQCK